LINVAKTSDISDILLKVYLNIDSDYYHTKSDSERYNIYSAYGQILSENELIQNNTTGLIYNDENNHFNFDLFNFDDDNLTYNPLIVYGLGTDKKTMSPINVDNIEILDSEDNWFLTSNISYQNDQHIIVHDSIVTDENELYSVIEFNDELTISGINLRLHFDSVTDFEILLKENYDYDTNIFWGDTTGSTHLQYTGMSVSALTAHTYQPGTYILTLDGKAEALDFKDNPYITEILSWSISNVSSLKYISFENNINLKSLPYESGRLSDVITFENVFKNTKIKSIPNGLFANNTIAINYNYAFYNCIELKNIPYDLFYNSEITMDYTFYNCINLTTVPNLTHLNSGMFSFYNCKKIQSINSTMTNQISNDTSFESMFENCISLSTISQDLFKLKILSNVCFKKTFKNTAITLPTSLFGFDDQYTYTTTLESTFEDCSNILTINNHFFDKCKSLTFESTFKNCVSLVSVPNNLFDLNVDVTTFESTFKNCESLVSVPNLFDLNVDVTTFESTFKNCISLVSVPNNLFDLNVDVTTFESTFENCNISTIPSFTYNIKVITFKSTFKRCNIDKIPESTFEKNILVESFESTFKETMIKQITTTLFDFNVNVKTFESTFENNPIHIIPNEFFTKNKNVISFKSTFKNCRLNIIPGLFFYNDLNKTMISFESTFERNQITIVFDSLFQYTINAINFTRTFKENILNVIPQNLFQNNHVVESFYETFLMNHTLTQSAPVLWDYTYYTNIIDFHDCFKDTGSLGSGGNSIPFDWGGKCSQSCDGL